MVKRDYQAEYNRRIIKALDRGLSRSQGRGHPKASETYASKLTTPRYDKRLEEAVRVFRIKESIKAAARAAHVSNDRLLRYLLEKKLVEKQKQRWKPLPDNRHRRVQIYSRGRIDIFWVPGYDEAAKAGRSYEAVGEFLDSNDPAHLEPFIGDYVTDINGKRHYFETRPNVLYRIDAEGPEPFEDVYQIVAT